MIIIIITLLGLILRLILAGQSLWLDEAASWVIASLPLKTLLSSLAGDFHPPLYYLLLKPWLSFAGQSETLLRLPGILVGTLTIPALYLLVKEIFIPKKRLTFSLAHLAALFLSLNPLHIYYSQELRMYSLSAFFATLSWYFFIKWLKPRHHFNYLFAFTIITILSFYTFYLSLFILISQWLYLVFYHKERLKPFIICNLIFIISLLPWLPSLFNQLKGGGYLTSALPGWAALSGDLSFKSIILIPAKFSLGRISILPKYLYYLVLGLTLSFITLLFSLTLRLKRAKPFLYWLLIPLVLAVITSIFVPILGYWRYIFLLPAFSALLALAIASLPQKLFTVNLILIILLFLFSNLYFFSNPKFQREDWSSLAKLIKQNSADTLLIVNFTDAFAPLKFYLPSTKVFPTQVRLGQLRKDLDQKLPLYINRRTRIFYLDYLSDLLDPKREVLSWLVTAGLKKKAVYQFAGLGAVYEYQAP